MPTLLVVHHSPSPTMHDLLEAVLDGTRADGLDGVDVRTLSALTASPVEVLEADGILLGTPANIGYMSGALKHFFDQAYYACLGQTDGLPVGLWVHGNDDTTGARSSVEKIATALGWTFAGAPVEVVGAPDADDREALWNLGATVAAATLGMA